MTRFAYSAILESGRRVSGTVSSLDRREAIRRLLQRGYHPVTVEPLKKGSTSEGWLGRNAFNRVTRSDLAVLTRQLASLLKAGLPVTAALEMLRQQVQHRRLERIVRDVEEKLRRDGGGLADALDEHPHVFDAVYRGLVRSGEQGGNLITVLNDLSVVLARSAKLRSQVWAAFIYPIFLVLLGGAAVFILMTFVIPRFEELFQSFGQALPAPTRALIAVSRFMAQWWPALLLGLAGCTLAVVAALRRPMVRQRLDRGVLALPILGGMFTKLEVSRIARTLSALLAGGVRILDALHITGQTARNLAIRATFAPMIRRVSGGEGLGEAVAKAGLFPALMVNLIRTGEQTGELPAMLGELAEIYDAEAERAVAGAVKLLEPTLIILMGGLIATIVAAVMLPIFQANALTT